MVWTEVTRFSARAGEDLPSTSSAALEVNEARPAMGRYSWFRLGSLRMISSAWMEACQQKWPDSMVIGALIWGIAGCELRGPKYARTTLGKLLHHQKKSGGNCVLTFLTTGRTHGFALSSRYAPIPCSTMPVSSGSIKRGDVIHDREKDVPHQVDLIRAGVCPVGCHQPEEGILRGLGDSLSWEIRGENGGRHVVCDVTNAIGRIGRRRVAVVELLRCRTRIGARRRHYYFLK